MYEFKKHNKELQKMLFLPINRALHERNLSWVDMVELLNKKGLKYTKSSLISTQQGGNFFCVDFNYFTRLYDALELPPITLDYLIECREQYNKLRPQKRNK